MRAVYRLKIGSQIDLKVLGNGKTSPNRVNPGGTPRVPVFCCLIFLLRWFKVSRNTILNNKWAAGQSRRRREAESQLPRPRSPPELGAAP